MHETLSGLDYEWWQLFDTKTKRFYYYNTKKQQTQWHRPSQCLSLVESASSSSSSSSSRSHLYPLASRLISYLIKNNHLFDQKTNSKFLNDFKQKLKEKISFDFETICSNSNSCHSIDSEIGFLLKELEYILYLNESNHAKQQQANLLAAYSNAKEKQQRRMQPRTNPNYINVDLIGLHHDGSKSMLKNTYVKVDDLNFNKTSHFVNIQQKQKRHISFQSLTKSFLILISLLKNMETLSPENSKIVLKLSKQISNDQHDKLRFISSSSTRLDQCNNKNKHVLSVKQLNSADSKQSLNNNTATIKTFKSSSLTRKCNNHKSDKNKKEKKMSTDNLIKSINGDLEDDLELLSSSEKKKSLKYMNQNFSRSYSNEKSTNSSSKLSTSSTTAQQLNTKKQQQQQQQETESQASKATGKKNQEFNIFNSISASSITDIRNLYQHTHSQFNQKFQTLRRSLNNKSSNKKFLLSYSAADTIVPATSAAAAALTTPTRLKDQDHDTTVAAATTQSILDELSLSFDIKFEQLQKIYPSSKRKTSNLDEQTDESQFYQQQPKFSLFSSKKNKPLVNSSNEKELFAWSNQTIQKPLIKTNSNNKTIKKESLELFKLVQMFMGDRKLMSNFSDLLSSDLKAYYSKSTNTFTHTRLQINTQDIICLEIIKKGWQCNHLRDELFLQIIKQTTCNLKIDSFLLGWQLMAICLSFFPPSHKLYPLMNDYISFHSIDHESIHNLLKDRPYDQLKIKDKFVKITHSCQKRLQRISTTGAKKGLKSPSLDEVVLSKNTINTPSLFGTSLDEIMSVQKNKFPDLPLPWIQTTLSEAVIRLQGAKTEGIFRVPGDLDEVNNLKVRLEQLWCSTDDADTLSSLNLNNINVLDNVHDPHLPASLLKLWYRELYEPLIPNEFYNECIEYCDRADKCINIIERLPTINKLVFTYLIRFLKVFAASDNVQITKMDANNLSMIMAPNCLRCKSNEAKVIMENTKKEMQFIKTLINSLDTSSIQGI